MIKVKNIPKYFSIIILMYFVLVVSQKYAYSQSIECTSEVLVYYMDSCLDKFEVNNRPKLKDTHLLIMSFNTGFSEEAEVYLNEKLAFREKLDDGGSSGITGKFISCNFSEKYNPILEVRLLNSNDRLSIVLDHRYQYLDIHYYRKKWVLYYRNYIIQVE